MGGRPKRLREFSCAIRRLKSLKKQRIICNQNNKTIYVAKNLHEEDFLIKKFSSEKNKNAYNEINILRTIKQNDNITRRPLHFETEKSIYLLYNDVYPYDLLDFINYFKKIGKNMNLYYCLYIFKKLINVSNFLLDNGILHCDFKPENICINNNCEPILIDFDYSQFIKSVDKKPRGTLIYMAPELKQIIDGNT